MAVVGAFMVPHPPLIIPEVGRGEEQEIKDTIQAYKKAAKKIAELKPDTIVIATPHSVMYGDYFHISPGESADGDFSQFGAPNVKIHADYNVPFVQELCLLADEEEFMAGMLGQKDNHLDHAAMIPLYFINQEYQDYKVVRVGLSGLSFADHYTLGEYIKETSDRLDSRTVFIASGDLSHRLKEDGPYGLSEEGPVYDKRIMEVMGQGDFWKLFDFTEEFCQRAGECGQRAFLIMAGALDRTKVSAEKLSYEGPFGVGYGICAYEVLGEDVSRNFKEQYQQKQYRYLAEQKAQEDPYVRLARKALEEYMPKHIPIKVPKGLPEEMLKQKAGVFVSLKKEGRLRGCIGTIAATTASIAEEIIQNAVSAGMDDPRFPEIRPEELPELEYSVDVLGAAQVVTSLDQLDVKKYGLILTKGRKRGLLLPNLEGVDTVEQQIEITRQKAGIRENEQDIRMERFEVVRHR